ncbi:hypothetical protein [Actinomadura madurae]|uniref:hypothetical protein n=1 Tax=Actinomadura madurae TaxID=1993 RepID=UPI00399A2BF1
MVDGQLGVHAPVRAVRARVELPGEHDGPLAHPDQAASGAGQPRAVRPSGLSTSITTRLPP